MSQMKLADFTEGELLDLMSNALIGHLATNPGMSWTRAIDDVVAWFSIAFRVPRTQGHLAMSVCVNKRQQWLDKTAANAGLKNPWEDDAKSAPTLRK